VKGRELGWTLKGLLTRVLKKPSGRSLRGEILLEKRKKKTKGRKEKVRIHLKNAEVKNMLVQGLKPKQPWGFGKKGTALKVSVEKKGLDKGGGC